MFSFKRKPPPSLDEQVEAAIDEVNRLIPYLPRGQSFWMEWKTEQGRPLLTLQERNHPSRLYP